LGRSLGTCAMGSYDGSKQVDAAAGVMIYVADLCTAHGWDLQRDVWEQRVESTNPSMLIWLGQLSHAILKCAQGIRGDAAVTWEIDLPWWVVVWSRLERGWVCAWSRLGQGWVDGNPDGLGAVWVARSILGASLGQRWGGYFGGCHGRSISHGWVWGLFGMGDRSPMVGVMMGSWLR